MNMKWTCRIIVCLGFFFEYLLPIILFGGVVPYTHGELAAGLTRAGYYAIFIVAYILAKKGKEKLLTLKKSAVRGILLSLFPVAFWLIGFIGLKYILGAIDSLVLYWHRIIIFIVIGRLFYIAEEAIQEKGLTEKKETDA